MTVIVTVTVTGSSAMGNLGPGRSDIQLQDEPTQGEIMHVGPFLSRRMFPCRFPI